MIILGSSSTGYSLLEDISLKAADQHKHVEAIF